MPKIPNFETLEETVAFWESQDSADYWPEMEKVNFEVNLHKNLFHPHLTVLAYRPEHCPGSQQVFEDILIEYVTSVEGRLMVIQDVPALQCAEGGKKYILEETVEKIERLLELDKAAKVQPNATLNVPIFSLKVAA